MSGKSIGRGAPVIALLCAMHGATAHAQDQAADEVLVSGAIALEGVSIFATLSPIAAFDYPGQVAVVERDEIETRQASSLADLFADIPGVTIDGGARRSGQVPTIRGIREEDILILIDGARQSFISGHDGRIFIEPDLLKRVEVVKGPVSSLYGSGALGGVIALTTVDALDFLEAEETQGVRLKAGFGSVDDEMLFATTAFARSKDGRFDVVGSIAYRDTGDIELGSGFTLPDDNQIVSGLLKGTAQLAPGLSLMTSWIYYQNDALTPNNPQGNSVPTTPLDNVFRDVLSDTVQSTLSYRAPDSNLVDANFQVYWSRNAVEEDEVNTPRTLSREVETLGAKVDNRSRFTFGEDGKLTLTYGGEYYNDQQTYKDNAPLGSTPIPGLPGPFDPTIPGNIPGGSADFYGVFAQAEIVLGNPLGAPGELTIIPGVRWDHFSNSFDGTGDDFEDIDEQATSPKLGVSYKPVPWLLLFANYGEAFRAPSFNEAYATGNHFPVVVGLPGPPFAELVGYNRFIPNPGLRPQDGNMVEVGGGLDFKDVLELGDTLKIKGSYWQSEVDNFIDLNVIPFGCTLPFNQDALHQPVREYRQCRAGRRRDRAEIRYLALLRRPRLFADRRQG